jgi:WD40 repeat protein
MLIRGGAAMSTRCLSIVALLFVCPRLVGRDLNPNARLPRVDRHGDALPPGATGRLRPPPDVPRAAVRRLEYSADGRFLASLDGDGRLFLWDPDDGTGRPLGDGGEGSPIRAVRFSADSRLLTAVRDNDVVQVWDSARPGFLPPLRFQAVSPRGWPDHFSPDGRTLLALGKEGALHIWDARTGQRRQIVAHKGDLHCFAVSPDGKLVATHGHDLTLAVWDLASGKELDRWDVHEAHVMAFTPDGRRVATKDNGGVHLWDRATGRKMWSAKAETRWLPTLAFSPDGKVLVGADYGSVLSWDADTGRELRRLAPAREGERFYRATLFAAPAGRLLVDMALDGKDNTMAVFDPATGRELARYAPRAPQEVKLTPDGRALVVTGTNLEFRDAVTARPLGTLPYDQRGPINAAAFRPDGKVLATGGASGTVLLWDVSGLKGDWPPQLVTYSDDELSGMWASLATGRDDAVHYLLASPRQAGPFVAARLKTIRLTDPAIISRLVANLDSDDFEKRDTASRELAKLGKVAERALRRALAGKPSAELKRRAKELFEEHRLAEYFSPELYEASAGVRVLELLGTDAARQILQEYARGPQGAWLTYEAAEALRRIPR